MYTRILIICIVTAIRIRNAVKKHTSIQIACLSGLFIGITLAVCVNGVCWAVGSEIFRDSFTETVMLDSYEGSYLRLDDKTYTWYEKQDGNAVEHAYKQKCDLFGYPDDSCESMDDVYNAACKDNTSFVYTSDAPQCEISYSHATVPEWYKKFLGLNVDDTYDDIQFTFFLPKK